MTTHPAKINIAILGTFSLLLGVGIYIFFRDPQKLYLANHLLLPDQSEASLVNLFPSWISWLTDSLPTAIHAFAFSLFTALIFRLNTSTIAISCVAWLVIDWVFELLQIFKPTSCLFSFNDGGIGGLFCGYIAYGVFDWNDMFSIFVGCILAYLTLWHLAKHSGD